MRICTPQSCRYNTERLNVTLRQVQNGPVSDDEDGDDDDDEDDDENNNKYNIFIR